MNVAGAIKASTSKGNVTASGCIRDADLHSVAGDVILRTTCRPESVYAQTTGGDVDVTLPPGRYALSTDTRFGDVSLPAPRSGIVDDPASKRRVRASTTAGDITVGRSR
jgi:DUF4097 and DUF4098 domain-containing protein YvlB